MKCDVFDAEIVRPNRFAIGSIFQNDSFANSRNELYFIVFAIPGLVHHPHLVHVRSLAIDAAARPERSSPLPGDDDFVEIVFGEEKLAAVEALKCLLDAAVGE